MDILNIENQARTVVKNMSSGALGHLRIAALPTLNEELELCLSKYASEYPKIHVAVDRMEGGDFIKSYIEENYDFYFGSNRLFVGEEIYESIVTMRTGLKLYVNSQIAPRINPDDPATLMNQPFVSVNPSDPALTAQILAGVKLVA